MKIEKGHIDNLGKNNVIQVVKQEL